MPDYLAELKTLTEGSFLEELDELNLEVEYRRAVQNSIGYMLLVRCGLDPSEYFEDMDFRDVTDFNTPQTLNALGVATGDISQMCLSAISRTVLALQRQPQKENRTFEPQQKNQYAVTEQENTQLERSFEYDRDHLHQAGRLQSAEPSAAPGGAGSPWEINMLLKCVFYSAERSQLLEYNPCEGLSAKGGKPGKKINALTDEQVKLLLDTVRGLPPYTFIMIALYSGLRREEILGLQWDCVFLDVPTPYISVRRAWRSEHNRPVISTTLKTKAARRDIPIPKCLTDCLREVKEKTESEYVVADRNGNPLSSSQFQRVWKYVTVRSTKPHNYYKYVNGQCVKCTVTPTPGSHQKNNPKLVYAIDFDVTPHQLRHTYITNLLYAGIDPKTVQYLAGHENSKTTMDIYAQVKYNKPEELLSVVNAAFAPSVGV